MRPLALATPLLLAATIAAMPAAADDDACGWSGAAGAEARAALADAGPASAARLLEPLAECSPRSALLLGGMLWIGDGVAVDKARACDLFERAADSEPEGAHDLATCFHRGEGRPRDHARSAELYRRAADAGFPMSACALGNQYWEGQGVPHDRPRALELCRRDAAAGVVAAQADLGRMYLLPGEHRDFAEAARWLRAAAENGDAAAALNYGLMHWNGDGMPRNRDAAADWLLEAAKGGQPLAPALLAKYWFDRGFEPGSSHMDERAALEAAYWLARTAMVDPEPHRRAQAREMMIGMIEMAPQLAKPLQRRLRRDSPTQSAEMPR